MSLTIKEYINLDATELIKLINSKKISSDEAFKCAYSLTNKVNPKLNFLTRKYKEFIASKNTSPQIPYLLKDCGLNLKGTETTYGTASLVGKLAEETCELTQKYLDMGLAVLGKTTTPEFCTTGVTETKVYGVTKNPWNLKHTPGGSSGGSGAAVAARIVPIASGDDGGGSIRIPAAFNGLVGLKPTVGVTTNHQQNPDSWMGLTTKHVLTRTTRDSLWVLINSCNKNYLSEKLDIQNKKYDLAKLLQSNKKYRIGFSTESFFGYKTDTQNQKAVKGIVELLKKNGHKLVEAKIDTKESNIKKAYLIIVAHSIYKHIDSIKIKKLNYKSVELSNWLLYVIGKKTSKSSVEWAVNQCEVIKNDIDHYMSDFDFFINPTTAVPAPKTGFMDLSMVEKTGIKLSHLVPNVETLYSGLDQAAKKGLGKTPNTQFTNLSGHPSISVPVSFSKDNTPLGVQITGRYFSELDLLKLSSEIENEIQFFNKIPDITTNSI